MGSACCSGTDDGGKLNEASGSLARPALEQQEEVVSEAAAAKGEAKEEAATKAKEAAKESPRESPKELPKEWTLSLVKVEGSRLGVDVDLSENVYIVVEFVHPGLVTDWNTAHPDLAVKRGDRIVSVNSVRSNARDMVDICKKEKTLELIVQRE
mmetsp:Transcript_68001/g.197070  ORF Transcript_68001/g.197070 Transcript_68001/m.197070 type:complete len:154 (+) Transcript_68001:52-513(+)